MSIYDSQKTPQIINQPETDSGYGSIRNFAELSAGAGEDLFKVNSEGMFMGSSKFSNAPFRVDYDGNVTASSATITGALTTGAGSAINGTYVDSLNANKINVGTLTGFTIQTATSGARARMTSSNYFECLYDNTWKGRIGATYSGNSLQIDTADDIYFTVNGINKIKFDTAGDINFASDGREISWSGGRKISADSSTITADGYFVATERIRADGYSAKISSSIYDGETDSDKLVTGVAQTKSGGYVTNVQYKEREIKFKGGIFWKFEGESGWTNAA